MKISKRILAFLTASVIAAGLSGCGKEETKTETAETGINVTVYEVSKEDINASAGYTGEIVGEETTAVSAQTSGTADGVYVEEGDYVTEGQTLLTIDSTNYRLAYNQALAAYNSALAAKKNAEASYNSVTGGSSQQSLNQLQSAMNSAKLAYDNALDIYNKQKTLFDMGAISEVEFNTYKTNMENAKLNYESTKTNYELTKDVVVAETEQSAKAGVETAEAGVNQAKAALDIAENNLNNCRVTAPISGYISSKNASRGQMVGAGGVLFTITDTSSVNVQINVTEAIILSVNTGTKALVSVSGAGLENIEGVVRNVNPVKNPQTGLYSVKISLANDEGKLKAGMIAKIELITDNKESTLVVPSSALMQSDSEGYYLYVSKGTEAEKRIVETGISNDEFTEILSGIADGDKIIVKGKEYLSEDNLLINVVEE